MREKDKINREIIIHYDALKELGWIKKSPKEEQEQQASESKSKDPLGKMKPIKKGTKRSGKTVD